MEADAKTKVKIPAGSMTKRREAMEAMAEAAKTMLKAHEDHGVLSLPEKYNVVASHVQEFIEWRKTLEFKHEPMTREELI